jgi:NitT/TauT family transport system substrate-binding protein
VVDFFEDHIRALRWFLDPAHHDDAVGIAQGVTKMRREDVDYVFTGNDSYRSPDGVPDVPATQAAIDHDLELGVIPKGLTVVPNYLDLSMAQEAKKRVDLK